MRNERQSGYTANRGPGVLTSLHHIVTEHAVKLGNEYVAGKPRLA